MIKLNSSDLIQVVNILINKLNELSVKDDELRELLKLNHYCMDCFQHYRRCNCGESKPSILEDSSADSDVDSNYTSESGSSSDGSGSDEDSGSDESDESEGSEGSEGSDESEGSEGLDEGSEEL